ncbi:HEPN domain-containing protein [Methylobacterium sp. UNC378MF]|uniref:HEPN domain-containing protein n=1 Tax=Methylobacterium sp. UNC378MF TaxID=1502748 RepID=UPI00088E8BCB|nr:HEPN domain-containing protein [Methylobacterium sp. UNC378MF]SDA15647.1 HEPN domain-containing protein [Methylobacterium sp. UNC378MF]
MTDQGKTAVGTKPQDLEDFHIPFSMRRTPLEMSLEERKIELALRMFVNIADQDYVTARWGFQNGLFHTFYWSGAQAIEKYLKAAILFRGESVENYGHNLKSLFARVRHLTGVDDLPKKLKIPKTTARGREMWNGKSIEHYVDYMNVFGSPDNRYAFEGLHINGPVLHALDFTCLHLRKTMNNNNVLSENLFRYRNQDQYTIKKGKKAPAWMIDADFFLERLYLKHFHVGENKETRKAFRTMNLAFFTDKHKHAGSFGGYIRNGSALHTYLVWHRNSELPGQSKENEAIIDQLRDWVGENMQLGDRARKAVGLPPKNK